MLFYYNGDATSKDSIVWNEESYRSQNGALEGVVLVSDGLDSRRVSNCEVSIGCGCHCGRCEKLIISQIFSHLQKSKKISTVHISQMFLYQSDPCFVLYNSKEDNV